MVKGGKGFPYSLPIVGPGADSGVQAVSPQVTISHPPGGRLPLLSAMPAVTFPAAEHHCPLAGTRLYCLVTEAHRCEQLAQGCYAYAALPRVESEPTTCWSQVQRSIPVAPPRHLIVRNELLHNTLVYSTQWLRFVGADPCKALYISTAIFNCTLSGQVVLYILASIM